MKNWLKEKGRKSVLRHGWKQIKTLIKLDFLVYF